MPSLRAMVAAAAAVAVSGAHATDYHLPPCLDPFRPFVYSGCFEDKGSPDALMWRTPLDQHNMTVETCASTCKSNGFRYAGLEYYGVCYCGSTVNTRQLEESECKYACSGNSSQICGADKAISIYTDPTFVPLDEVDVEDFAPLGCYTDDGGNNGRALIYPQNVDGPLTTEKCLKKCRDGGFPFSGTEYAGECFCGNVIGNHSVPAPAGECNMACNGDSTQTCGGPNRLNLYVAEELKSLEPCGYVPPEPQPSSSATSTSATVTASSSASSSATSATEATSSSASSSATSATEATASSTTSATSSTSEPPASSSSSSSSTAAASSSSSITVSSTPSSTSASSSSSSTSSAESSTIAPPTTTPPTASTTTSSSLCVVTTTIAPACEYQCGNWCSDPLPEWDDDKGCKNGFSHCQIQVSNCFAKAGWPASLECFDFSKWCQDVNDYCGKTSGGGSKFGFCNNKPPKAPVKKSSATTTVITTSCPPVTTKPAETSTTKVTTAQPTTTKATTTTKPATTVTQCPIPTPTNICKQASSPMYGYGPGKPVGGIEMPIVTCNDLSDEHDKYPFKRYSEKDSRQCAKYPRNNVVNACNDACKEQYDDCVEVYAETCKRNNPPTGLNKFWVGGWGWKRSNYFDFKLVEKRTFMFGWSDNHSQATAKCKAQYTDCVWANMWSNGYGKCNKFAVGPW